MPWTNEEFIQNKHAVLDWIKSQPHLAALRFFTDQKIFSPENMLHESASEGNFKLLDVLLEAFQFDSLELSLAIESAAQGPHARFTDSSSPEDSRRRSAFRAAGHRYLEVADKILPARTSIDAVFTPAHTSLQIAALNAHLEVAEKLLAGSANVNLDTTNEIPSFRPAALNSHLEVVERLLAAGLRRRAC
jgi:hypothetical protein